MKMGNIVRKLQDSLDRGEVKQVLASVRASVRASVLASVLARVLASVLPSLTRERASII